RPTLGCPRRSRSVKDMLHYHQHPRAGPRSGRWARRGAFSREDYTLAMPGTEAPRWRFLITPKWLAWHLTMVVAVWGMLWLGDWQSHRAISGTPRSGASTFEWRLSAVSAVVFGPKTIGDESPPPAAAKTTDDNIPLPAGAVRKGGVAGPAGEPASPEEEADLAAYNAYLARLHREVKGHSRGHGVRSPMKANPAIRPSRGSEGATTSARTG